MLRLIATFIAACSLWAVAHAETLINLEEAAEVENLRIYTEGAAAGHVYARVCDACELLKLRIDATTRIVRSRQALGLASAAALSGKGATVLFDPRTQKVTRILYWN